MKAKLSRVTRSRLSQILLLTNLAPAIQEELLFLPRTINGPERITEGQLRSIAKRIEWSEQMERFRSLWGASSLGRRRTVPPRSRPRPSALSDCSRISDGTHALHFSETTAPSGPASAECVR
jgi:hypothetical protein